MRVLKFLALTVVIISLSTLFFFVFPNDKKKIDHLSHFEMHSADFKQKFQMAFPSKQTDGVAKILVKDRTWEQDVQRMLYQVWDKPFSKEEKSNLFFLDIGANMGFMGLLGISYGWKTVMIEALPFNVHMIQSSIDINDGFSKKSILLNVALNEKKGDDLCVIEPPGNPSDGILVPWDMEKLKKHEWVNAVILKRKSNLKLEDFCVKRLTSTTLDDVILSTNQHIKGKYIIAIKIDIEGLELNVLKGGKHVIDTYKPCGIVLEINPGLSIPNGWAGKEMVEFMKEMDYHVHNYPGLSSFNIKGELRNVLFLPKTTHPHCVPSV